MADYHVPAGITCYQQEIKKSRFIACSAPAATPEAARIFIDQIKLQYPDAQHVCWAFVAGQPQHTAQVGFSDAGEPNGTAGMPMLKVLQHGDIGDIVVVVVRYFGGIKLGTGGLARAYSSSVSEVLKLTSTQQRVTTHSLTFEAPFALEDPVRRSLAAVEANQVLINYADHLQVQCDVPEQRVQELIRILVDLSRGQIRIKS